MGAWVQLKAADGVEIPAWVAKPEGPVRGAVVVAQEIFGVNSHIRAVTERFAARGFWAIAPALFTRAQPDVELGYTGDDMQQGRVYKTAIDELPGDVAMTDLRAAVQWIAQESGGQKVGMVGFCWGGLLAWRAAAQMPELSAAVSYYGGGMTTPAERVRQPLCPVMAHFGRLDTHIPMEGVLEFIQAQPEVQTHLYDAQHGFNCDVRGSYDEASAVQAKDRTLAFFDAHLAAKITV